MCFLNNFALDVFIYSFWTNATALMVRCGEAAFHTPQRFASRLGIFLALYLCDWMINWERLVIKRVSGTAGFRDSPPQERTKKMSTVVSEIPPFQPVYIFFPPCFGDGRRARQRNTLDSTWRGRTIKEWQSPDPLVAVAWLQCSALSVE